MKIKICGVRSEVGAKACAAAGVDLVGFNFVPGRRRAVRAPRAAALASHIGGARPVGVFLDAPRGQVEDTATQAGLPIVQLHGVEPPEMVAELRAAGWAVMKALRVDATLDPGLARAHVAAGATLLLDGPRPGQGVRFDPASLGELDASRAFVAGGLSAETVGGVVRALAPLGVDTASGVEADGHIDPRRVRAFCAAARRAFTGALA